jgi:MFS family permease
VLRALWRADIIVVFVIGGVLWASHLAYASFITPLAISVGLPEWTVGVSIAAGLLIEAAVFSHGGRWIARFGAQRLLVGTVIITVLRWLALSVATSAPAFIGLHALHGITFGVMYVTLVHLLGERVPAELRQTAQTTLGSTALGLGGVAGALAAGNAIAHGGAQQAWLTMAAIAALALIAVAVNQRVARSR